MKTPRARVSEDEALLTVGYVRKLQVVIKNNEALLKSLPATIAADKKKLAAALVFVPEGALDQPKPQTQSAAPAARKAKPQKVKTRGRSKQITWRSEALKALLAAQKPMMHGELLDELKKTELGKRVSEGAKGFYNALAALLKEKEIERHGAYLYSAALAAQMRARGEDFPVERPAGGSAAIVLDILEKHPAGLSGPQLQDEIGRRRDAPRSMRDHKQYVYNILAPLRGRGIVVQDGSVYRLVSGADKKPRQIELPMNGSRKLPDFLKSVLDDGKPRSSGELGAMASAERLIDSDSAPGRVVHGVLLNLNNQGAVKRTDDRKWVKA